MVLHCKHLNTRRRLQRADILADAATIADFLNHIWLLDCPDKAVQSHDLHLPGTDGFLWNRAMLFTDNAVDLAGIRQTMIFIENRLADHFAPLGFNRKGRNRPGRTNLTTESAIIFAVSQPGNKQRGIYAL